MSVRILIIEDDPSFLEVLEPLLSDLGSDVSIQVAKSRDSALAVLEEESFDIILLDLKLPTVDGALDEDPEHGRFVLHQARQLATGTPIVVLTGSPAESFISNFLEYSEQVDIWGDEHKIATVQFLRKSQLDELLPLLMPWVDSIRSVEYVEIRSGGDGVNLTWEENRLVRIFVRRRGGASCIIGRINGGLSGAGVLRVFVLDEHGAPLLSAIVKIATSDVVATECENYSRYAQRLSEQATPRLFEDVRFGGGKKAAVTYRLAEGFRSNLFDIALTRADEAAEAVARAANLLAPWREGIGETRSTIREVRARLVPDERARRLAAQYGLDWIPSFERRQVQLRWCPIHGDLHGGNVLVDEGGVPIIIDYGDVGLGPSPMDWVTLELSTIFHVEGPARNSEWPTAEDCGAWPNAMNFAANSPVSAFILACRHAAEATGVGPRELAACAYAYLLRQLSYDDTDKAAALALIERVRRFIEDET